MTQPKTTRIPAPLYAAAGAGDLAFRKLRQLPAVVTDLTDKAAESTAELREKATATLRTANTAASDLRTRTGDLDIDRVRGLALRNAAAVLSSAYAAQERAVAAYAALVAHGERVIGSGVVQAADTVNADMEVTEVPAAAAGAATPAEVASSTAATTATSAVKATSATTATSAVKATKRTTRSTTKAAGRATKSTGTSKNTSAEPTGE